MFSRSNVTSTGAFWMRYTSYLERIDVHEIIVGHLGRGTLGRVFLAFKILARGTEAGVLLDVDAAVAVELGLPIGQRPGGQRLERNH